MAKTNGPLSGFRDYIGVEALQRDEVLSRISKVFEKYGFEPLKTPAIERYETLSGKYGEDGQKLIYHFKDQGEREIALRYDLTVPLARVIGEYQNDLNMPYKRYAIGEVWRGERPQKGRYREFTQFDADIVGSSSYLTECEMLSMMSDAFTSLDVKATIRVNDRRILNALSSYCGIEDSESFIKLVGIIDNLGKITINEVLDKIEKEFNADVRNKVEQYLSINGSNEDKIDQVSELLEEYLDMDVINNVTNIFSCIKSSDYTSGIVFDQTIARGLDYYTGTIYETILDDLPEIGSVCSGGRYDNLIGQLGGPNLPAIGTSIGVDRLIAGLVELEKIDSVKNSEIYVTLLDDKMVSDVYALTQSLRRNGIKAEMSYESKKLNKQLDKVNKLGIKKVLIYGPSEKEKRIVILKDMVSGEQKEIDVTNIVDYLK